MAKDLRHSAPDERFTSGGQPVICLDTVRPWFDGLGLRRGSLDGNRLYFETDLREDLPALSSLKWKVTLLNKSCLVAVPDAVWPEFKQYMQRFFQTPEDQEFFTNKFEMLAYTVRKIDTKGRWWLSPHLFAEDNAEIGPSVLIVPRYGWLEFWDEEVWRKINRHVPVPIDS